MHKNVRKNLQLAKTFLILRKKIEEIREVSHFENGIEHKILITHVIAKVSAGETDELLAHRYAQAQAGCERRIVEAGCRAVGIGIEIGLVGFGGQPVFYDSRSP